MPSFEKINYLLRPSKQVERKLLIEALQRLSKAGYFLPEYTYLGLGSVYFADFVLFHKYLLIDDMICAEMAPIPKRMEFNKPYDFVTLKMTPVSDVFPILNREKRHLAWLDFDSALDEDMLGDIRSCIHVLAPGSILLVTVTADPVTLRDLLDPVEAREWNDVERKEEMVKKLNELMSKHIGRDIEAADIGRNSLPKLFANILLNFINTCTDARSNVKFFPLFNYKYADNLQMLTFGGIIDHPESASRLATSGIYDLDFITPEPTPIKISVPHLTTSEKVWLEKYMVKNSTPPEPEFEMKEELIKNFIRYYRHYPTYYETLV